MKSFSDKTNIGTDVTLKTVYMIRFYLLLLLTGVISVVGATQVYGQQSRSISGVVRNSQGETIIGANIVEKGTNNGTITNVDGLFTLRVSPNAVLKVSYMGYIEQEVSTRNKSKLEITMVEDARLIDEVVVVGYGSVKKRDLTGAVTSVKSAEVLAAPTSNVMEALQGKIPGMDITKTSGQVGGEVSILLRGSRSIYGNNEPLFIIDGIPGSYSQVNPSDIESVDVLKDASSTAIYGSAGANGVVIITTKRGKEGKATINFDAYYGFSGSPNYKHGMTQDEWVTYQKEAYRYKNGDFPSDMSALLGKQAFTDAYNAGKWIDWVDEVSSNTATTQKYSLSVSSGTEKTRIFASTSYNREEGLLSNENLNRYSLRLNIDQQLFSWAKVGFTSNLVYRDLNSGVKNTFTRSLSAFPLGDAYNEEGKINHEYITGQYSPMGDFIENQYANNTRSTYLNMSGYVELTPLKDFTFTSRINGTLNHSRRGQYWGNQCNANRPSYAGSPHASITNDNAWNYTWENILAYSTTLAKAHTVGGSLITSWNKNQSESNMAAASGQMVDQWSFWRLTSGSSPHVESDFAQTQKMSFAFRLNYSYKSKYLFNFSTRWDGVSQFSAGHKWDAYNEEGKINHEYITGQYSPMGDFIENQYANNTRSTYLNMSGYVELTPLKDFTFTSRINGTLNHSRRGQYWGNQCNANRPSYAGSPHASITNDNAWNYTWENILAYSTTLAKAHTVGGSLITSWNKNQSESNMAAASGQMVDQWSFWRLTSGSSPHVESDFAQTQKMSFAFRLNYSYKSKYLFNFSTRWDGVSQFSAGHKWDAFPAGAIAWRISDEAFMEKTRSWLDNLKLRVSYGITGNSGETDAYSTTTQAYVYSASGVSVNGKIVPFTQYSETYGSADLGWEKSYNWNIGLDFGILNSRIDGSIEWFRTTTKGLLFKRILPITSGLTGWGSPLSIWQNIAQTSNQGVEVILNSHNIQHKDFTWNTTLSATWSKEKIDKLPDGDLISENLFTGEPIHAIYGYKYAGIWGSDTPKETLDAYGVNPGFIKIETVDKNGDGGVHKYSTDDRQILGHTNPDWIIGLNNSFTYKNFDLSVFAMARYGQTINSDLLGYYTAEQSVTKNQLAGVDYWTEDNQGAYFPRPGTGDEQKTVYPSLRVHDGSFIKIKNITLGYTLPANISRKVLMEKCRIYATAYNPFIFVKDKQLKDTDPETNGSDAFPTYRQFVFGVNLTF